MVSFLPADFTTKIYYNKISLYWAGVKSTPVTLERLPKGNGILDDHINFVPHRFLWRYAFSELSQRLPQI